MTDQVASDRKPRNPSVGNPETVVQGYGPRRPWQGVSDVRVDSNMRGYEAGFNDAREELQDILTSLIAESRAWLAGDHPEPLVWMLDRAEARLKRLADD